MFSFVPEPIVIVYSCKTAAAFAFQVELTHFPRRSVGTNFIPVVGQDYDSDIRGKSQRVQCAPEAGRRFMCALCQDIEY